MKNAIYALGIASFLAMFIFTVATSLTNPFYGMNEEVLAEKIAEKRTGPCPLSIGYCLPTGCQVSGYVDTGSGDVSEWHWQYIGCNSYCKPGGNNCCYSLDSGNCD